MKRENTAKQRKTAEIPVNNELSRKFGPKTELTRVELKSRKKIGQFPNKSHSVSRICSENILCSQNRETHHHPHPPAGSYCIACLTHHTLQERVIPITLASIPASAFVDFLGCKGSFANRTFLGLLSPPDRFSLLLLQSCVSLGFWKRIWCRERCGCWFLDDLRRRGRWHRFRRCAGLRNHKLSSSKIILQAANLCVGKSSTTFTTEHPAFISPSTTSTTKFCRHSFHQISPTRHEVSLKARAETFFLMGSCCTGKIICTGVDLHQPPPHSLLVVGVLEETPRFSHTTSAKRRKKMTDAWCIAQQIAASLLSMMHPKWPGNSFDTTNPQHWKMLKIQWKIAETAENEPIKLWQKQRSNTP